MRVFPLVFFVLLFVEVWSIIKVGHQIGTLATLMLLIAGVIVGMQLMRSQGISALRKTTQQMKEGQSPLAPLAAAIINAFAGLLFMFPGFVGDVMAITLLLPFVRNAIVLRLLKKSQFQGFAAGSFGDNPFGSGLGGFGAQGFGRAANDDPTKGNVYEHDASATPKEDAVEGKVIDFIPHNKRSEKD